MKILNKIILVGLVLVLYQADCVAMQVQVVADATQAADINLRKQLLERYAPSVTLRVLIETYKEEIIQKEYPWGRIPEIPGIYMKGCNLRRIINAERARECIRRHNLFHLDVARKYVYAINNKLIVFAEDVEGSFEFPLLTLEVVKQMVTFAEETGYMDWHGRNIIVNAHGKFVFIDTENQSFCHNNASKTEAIDGFLSYRKNDMIKEAQDWVTERLLALNSNPDLNKFHEGTIQQRT